MAHPTTNGQIRHSLPFDQCGWTLATAAGVVWSMAVSTLSTARLLVMEGCTCYWAMRGSNVWVDAEGVHWMSVDQHPVWRILGGHSAIGSCI